MTKIIAIRWLRTQRKSRKMFWYLVTCKIILLQHFCHPRPAYHRKSTALKLSCKIMLTLR